MRAGLFFAVLGLAGCAGESVDSDSDTDTETDTGFTPPTALSLSGTLTVWTDGAPLAGADVCWREPAADVCVAADADGEYALELPFGAVGTLTVEHALAVPTAFPLGISDVPDISFMVFDLALDDAGYLGSMYEQAGLTLDEGTSTLAFVALGASHVTFDLAPVSGVGPYYLTAEGDALDLEATDSGPATGLGVGYQFDVDPTDGPFDVVAEPPSGTPCAAPPFLAFTAAQAFEALPGFETALFIGCD